MSIYIEYGITYDSLKRPGVYTINFASRSEAAAYISERIADYLNPRIVHRRTTHKPGTGHATDASFRDAALTDWTVGEVQYCELGNQKCLAAVTACVEARSVGCTVDESGPIYVCNEHVPTLADTLAHNERQDTTLIAFESRRLDSGGVIETYDAQKADSE